MEITLQQVIDHTRNWSYMGGLERDLHRKKFTGEHFTPTTTVQQILDQYEKLDPTIFRDPEKTIIDPAGVGDGQLLSECLIRKIQNGINFEKALSSLYGVDIMLDNVELCRQRLLCGQRHFSHIVEKNIICADMFRMNNWLFNGIDPNKTPQELLLQNLFI